MSEPAQFLRYIEIDNLKVGYDYPKKQFYISNKDTTTYRGDIEYIFTILRDVFNISLSPELQAQIQDCKDKVETLGTDKTSLFYTWSTDGSYIYSMQFNEWQDYPLILEAEKARLRVNDTIVIDLTSNESIEFVVAPTLCKYYLDTLGLSITNEQMASICNFLIYFYKPTCINLIAEQEQETDPLKYSNQFKLTNYNNTSVAEYIVTNNPYNTYNYEKVADIISLSNSNQITVSDLNLIEDKYTIQQGTKLQITGISEEVEGEEYSANGTYTVQDIEDNLITVEEAFPMDYEYPFYNCYVVLADYSIVSISRDNSTITLTEAPNNILVGDKIIVVGANQEVIKEDTTFETIILDKEYTVQAIQGNTITVEEEFATNFNGSNAKVYKNKLISPIKSIDTDTKKIVTFLNTTEYNLLNNTVMCYNSNIQNIDNTEYTVTSMLEADNKYIGIETDKEVNIEMAEYPQLQYPVPSEDMLIEVTKVNEEYKSILPTEKFILNSYSEADAYIGLCPNLLKPSDMAKSYEEDKNLYTRDIKDNLYSMANENIKIPITILGEENYFMTASCLGKKTG